MKRGIVLFSVLVFVLGIFGTALAADVYDTIKKRGTLIGGVKDSTPGFGYIDQKTREIVGYDVDFLKAIADKMGVKLELKPVTSASRMPQLMAGNIDIIAATMTKNAERAKQIDFSYAYFMTGQKFIVRKGKVKSIDDLNGKRIGTAKGSTSEQNATKALPKATVISYDDYPQSFLALQQGKVFAITTDESILAQLLGKAPEKNKYEITKFAISDEPYGLGIAKGSPKFLKLVNDTILEMEKKGQAKKIFDKWFGPKSETPMQRGSFKISDKQ